MTPDAEQVKTTNLSVTELIPKSNNKLIVTIGNVGPTHMNVKCVKIHHKILKGNFETFKKKTRYKQKTSTDGPPFSNVEYWLLRLLSYM